MSPSTTLDDVDQAAGGRGELDVAAQIGEQLAERLVLAGQQARVGHPPAGR